MQIEDDHLFLEVHLRLTTDLMNEACSSLETLFRLIRAAAISSENTLS